MTVGRAEPTPIATETWWPSLQVRDLTGAPLNPIAHWYVIVFLGQECPVSNASIPVLNQLAADFASRGVALIGAYVDPTADLPALRAHVTDYALKFPTADDRSQRLAHFAGVTYTPEVAVFSAAGAKLYQGRIDDRVGAQGATRPAAVHEDLREVLTALAAGKPAPFPSANGYGCALPEAIRP